MHTTACTVTVIINRRGHMLAMKLNMLGLVPSCAPDRGLWRLSGL
jgi:hypothetical protein